MLRNFHLNTNYIQIRLVYVYMKWLKNQLKSLFLIEYSTSNIVLIIQFCHNIVYIPNPSDD